VSTLFVWCTI